jgi:hypothetical protein
VDAENQELKEEKRKAKRINKALFARYVTGLSATSEKWDMVNIKNISETGMCFPTSENFSAGQILTILIKIPLRPQEWIEFKSKVVGCEKIRPYSAESTVEMYVLRVEFMDVKEEFKQLLKQYIAMFKK